MLLNLPSCMQASVQGADVHFSVNMSENELSDLLRLKGVVEEDCAAFKSES